MSDLTERIKKRISCNDCDYCELRRWKRILSDIRLEEMP